jgi:1-aminocyclopropane-1-carboxylate deaminase
VPESGNPAFDMHILLESLTDDEIREAGIDVKVLRLDKIDLVTGGNKWFKLKWNLLKCRELGHEKVLTFGGAFSNHIAATAAATKLAGLSSVGIIRGEPVENSTLLRAKADGMALHFVSREQYKNFRNGEEQDVLTDLFGSFYQIPEGGSNEAGAKGCMEIASLIPEETDAVMVPVGTGATMAGLIAGLKGHAHVIGISVVKAPMHLENAVLHHLSTLGHFSNFTFVHDFTFGGYARKNRELESLVATFNATHNFEIEPVYTGKMLAAFYTMMNNNSFKKGAKVVLIHTGGLQYLH